MGGWAIVILGGERATGLSAIQRALELNPNCALAWNFSGWVQGFSNRPAPAIEALQRAMRLSPLDPQRWMFEGGLALAHLVAGRYEEAIEWVDRALQENTRAMAVLRLKAAACGQLGRIEEGRECVRRLRELVPGSTVAGSKEGLRSFVSPEVLNIYADGLLKAGLPEG
jgi:adenylate cyclase